ncbi:MAG TPA: NDP-sugar synthase, partial [Candidatus Binataceae bacterium]|nr:NDP-sugar synthase [Candidatus Binataceae bacterium]
IPEPLLLIELEPALDLIIRRLETAGINEVVVFDRACAREIGALVQSRRYRAWVQVLPEPELAGDAGALKQIERVIHGTFLVGSINSIFALDLRALIEAHFRHSALVTVASPKPAMKAGGNGGARRVWPIESPTFAERLNGTAAYVMEPRVLASISRQGSHAIARDLLPLLIREEKPVFAAEISTRSGALDSLENYLQSQRGFLHASYADGFIHPSVTIAPDVQLKPPFFIGPASRLERGAIVGPDTILSADVVIGAGSRVSDSMIYPGVRIGSRCSIQHSLMAPDVCLLDDVTLEPNVIVGAGAHIRSQSVLRAGARVTPNSSFVQQLSA